MTLPEIEFELSADQYRLMGYPKLNQGQFLSIVLDGGVLFPDPAADGWYTVQPEPLPAMFKRVSPAQYAFAGQIAEADIHKHDGDEVATLLVDCGPIDLRITCAPGEDGLLPYGTWETRYIAGYARVQGIVEDAYETPIGRNQGVTIWSFRRLLLTPGDSKFGEWYESVDLPSTPYKFDRVFVIARVHREVL
jgi:hypothetical protein